MSFSAQKGLEHGKLLLDQQSLKNAAFCLPLQNSGNLESHYYRGEKPYRGQNHTQVVIYIQYLRAGFPTPLLLLGVGFHGVL